MLLEYQVPYNERIAKAIEYAKIHEKIHFPQKELDNWKTRNLLSFSALEHIFEINAKYADVPVIYQNIWFCLHEQRITRYRAGGRLINPPVSFYPIYIEISEENIKLIKDAIKVAGSRDKFAKLVCYDTASLNAWLLKKRKPPVTSIIKSCQILGIDFWDELENTKLYGKTSKDYITFTNNYPNDIDDIRIWIENEGSLATSSTEITFKQNESGLDALRKLQDLFIHIFGIKGSISFDKNSEAYLLRIISAPIRQVLCLKYNIPLGYKIYSQPSTDLFEFVNRQEGLRKLARNLETEGCFTFIRKKNADYLRVSFGSANRARRDLFTGMANNLGFKFMSYDQEKRRNYHSVIVDNTEIIKLINEIAPYMWNKNKINKAIQNPRLKSEVRNKIKIENYV
ncbi:MAG: hypothetical protein HZB67_05940 [Candidatus Aenigmarchaeota archaeon]|nr:hypothetical protein [Candidatus Aenigmarchaeota archaeon]